MRHDADDAARARDISPRCRVSATRFPVRSFGLRALVGVVVVVVVVAVAVLPQRVSSRTPVCEGRRFKRKKKIWFCSRTRKSRHLSFFFKAAAAVENNTHAPPEPSSSSSSSSPPFGRRSLLVNTAKNNWLCKVL